MSRVDYFCLLFLNHLGNNNGMHEAGCVKVCQCLPGPVLGYHQINLRLTYIFFSFYDDYGLDLLCAKLPKKNITL